MTHTIKIWPEFFKKLKTKKKPFEIRKNDRGYKEGDILILLEWKDGQYTGNAECREVTYVLDEHEGLQEGYAILGIKEVGE